MKRAISTIIGLFLLAGLIILSVYLFQTVGSQPASAVIEPTQAPNYPPPYDGPPVTGYPPPPIIPTISETELAELSATNLAEVTAIVAKTLTAQPTPTDQGGIVGEAIIYDPLQRYRLQLPSGWRAWPDETTIIVNYNQDIESAHEFPSGGIKVQIGVGKLADNKTFEEWQTEWIALEISPDFAGSGVTASTPQPFTLGNYEGTAFFIKTPSLQIMEINILRKDQIIIIGLTSADSIALNDALAMLATLEILP